MSSASFRFAAGLATTLALTGCITTTPQADGSTRVRVSLGGAPAPEPSAAPAGTGTAARATPSTAPARAAAPAPVSAPGIRTTALAGLFTKHPFDGTPKTHFPRVAVTVVDWSRSDCWVASATIWWSKGRSESVAPFSVCWGQSVGFAVNNAAQMHMFMGQSAVEHSGNVRTTGPKPPMLVIPDRQPIGESQQVSFQGFIQQLLLDTGWGPGAPTNFWLVGYDAAAGTVGRAAAGTPAPRSGGVPTGAEAGAARPYDPAGQRALEDALACKALGSSIKRAEALLTPFGYQFGAGITPIALPRPVSVHGLSTTKVGMNRDGGEQSYVSHFQGVTLQQVIAAASLKKGRDEESYGRATKVGVLTVSAEGAEVVLTCSVNVEG